MKRSDKLVVEFGGVGHSEPERDFVSRIAFVLLFLDRKTMKSSYRSTLTFCLRRNDFGFISGSDLIKKRVKLDKLGQS